MTRLPATASRADDSAVSSTDARAARGPVALTGPGPERITCTR